MEEDGKEHLGMKLVSGHYVKERKEKVSRKGKQTMREADLFKVSWVKSPLGHKKRDSPIGQSQLAAFTADACIGETVRFKAWGKDCICCSLYILIAKGWTSCSLL